MTGPTPVSRPRLSDATLATLPSAVARPAYERAAIRIGIVHLGAGAFHRAHQAVYFDDALALDPDWAVCAVSLRNPDVRDALRPQGGLYTLAILGQMPQLRIVGALRGVLCARDEAAAVLARLADPAVRLVTLTVTEKGYCLVGDRLDFAHPDIVHDLATPDAPVSAIGHIVAGLARRRAAGHAPYTVLSCDNLADNGVRLRRAVLDFAQRLDPALADWIAAEVAFPRSMVDSITPATDDALRNRVADALGEDDAWPVQREPYTQWVVEDRFCNGRPPLERVGVTLSDDIAGFDRAKLRLLNGPHSALAYLGLLLGLETVADAMRHPGLAAFVERLMREDIAPTLDVPVGLDLDAYIGAILDRFRNPAIAHRLAQIAWDGSQKLPVRLLGTIRDALAAGRPIDRLCLPIAAWMHFVRRQARDGVALVDPMADSLAKIGREATGEAEDVARFLVLREVFGEAAGEAAIVDAIARGYAALCRQSESAIAS
ncbi:mannitol dehydrogenase family protein [Luteimonas sp. FCS-9]|uniref:mannitol dehydrogenase family protein n=1 Tax=Luteimonas sp. FCS-9 TaxID=1547516 RepID=UPI00063E6E94|nr:mannitol dehydrogenase family protein [Luteimonas sp. FCS-9]KLJ00387.1 mannitol dehydrogenase [Luteimonas sp. FCS-9]